VRQRGSENLCVYEKSITAAEVAEEEEEEEKQRSNRKRVCVGVGKWI